MVDVKCAVSCFGLPPDAETSVVKDHLLVLSRVFCWFENHTLIYALAVGM